MVKKFQVATVLFSCTPPYLKFTKLLPVVDADKLFSKLSIKQSETKNSAVCLKIRLITLTSSLSHYSYQIDEWVDCESYNKLMLFLPHPKITSHFSPRFSLCIYSSRIFISLSLGSKLLIGSQQLPRPHFHLTL
jgi:hypothetical protein